MIITIVSPDFDLALECLRREKRAVQLVKNNDAWHWALPIGKNTMQSQ